MLQTFGALDVESVGFVSANITHRPGLAKSWCYLTCFYKRVVPLEHRDQIKTTQKPLSLLGLPCNIMRRVSVYVVCLGASATGVACPPSRCWPMAIWNGPSWTPLGSQITWDSKAGVAGAVDWIFQARMKKDPK